MMLVDHDDASLSERDDETLRVVVSYLTLQDKLSLVQVNKHCRRIVGEATSKIDLDPDDAGVGVDINRGLRFVQHCCTDLHTLSLRVPQHYLLDDPLDNVEGQWFHQDGGDDDDFTHVGIEEQRQHRRPVLELDGQTLFNTIRSCRQSLKHLRLEFDMGCDDHIETIVGREAHDLHCIGECSALQILDCRNLIFSSSLSRVARTILEPLAKSLVVLKLDQITAANQSGYFPQTPRTMDRQNEVEAVDTTASTTTLSTAQVLCRAIREMVHLKQLALKDMDLHDDNIVTLFFVETPTTPRQPRASHFQQLRSLALTGRPGRASMLTDESLRCIAKACGNRLRVLDVSYNPRMTAEGLEHVLLYGACSLRELGVATIRVPQWTKLLVAATGPSSNLVLIGGVPHEPEGVQLEANQCRRRRHGGDEMLDQAILATNGRVVFKYQFGGFHLPSTDHIGAEVAARQAESLKLIQQNTTKANDAIRMGSSCIAWEECT